MPRINYVTEGEMSQQGHIARLEAEIKQVRILNPPPSGVFSPASPVNSLPFGHIQPDSQSVVGAEAPGRRPRLTEPPPPFPPLISTGNVLPLGVLGVRNVGNTRVLD
eukprot:5119033-Pyramimonas_sp.AAC.1